MILRRTIPLIVTRQDKCGAAYEDAVLVESAVEDGVETAARPRLAHLLTGGQSGYSGPGERGQSSCYISATLPRPRYELSPESRLVSVQCQHCCCCDGPAQTGGATQIWRPARHVSHHSGQTAGASPAFLSWCRSVDILVSFIYSEWTPGG